MVAIFWKEMADHFGRRRFVFLLALVALGVAWGWGILDREVEGGAGSIDEFLFLDIFVATSSGLPSLLFFMSFFGPLIGIVLGFDSINAERTQGTLSRVLAQPVYRDAVFNGKFLAGLVTLIVIVVAMVLGVVGLGMFILGYAPRGEEVLRISGFTGVSIAYLAFWLAVAMACSVFFRNTVTSALMAIGLWLLTSFIFVLIAGFVADLVVEDVAIATIEEQVRHFRVEQWALRASPAELFREAATTLLNPDVRTLGVLLAEQTTRLLGTPISASQSLRLVWPHIVVLFSGVAMVLAVSYTKFMREEVRS